MPELPEVTTTVNGLQKVLPGLVISNVWTDLAKRKTIKQFEKTIKNENFFKKFKREIIGTKILKVERRAKNILIYLSNDEAILIHLKMTGHLLFGKYNFNKKENRWIPDKNEKKELHDPYNRFIHVVFSFGGHSTKLRANIKQLVFCDSRKFGKVTLLSANPEIKELGPEPLNKEFTFEKFKKQITTKTGNIKTVLMNQSVIAGIGNIYSDEMLWLSGIHPKSEPSKIIKTKLKDLYKAMKKVLNGGIKFGGDSMSDYRNIDGGKGKFQNKHNVYQKKNEKCGKKGCRGVIIREVINSRSSHFCNKHQIIYGRS
jgi:formamidopyrimidine-DNA glycosylase